MSPRYVAWRSHSEWGWQDRPTTHVIEDDPTPIRTGLLDQHGTPLYRMPERVPLGFDLTVRRKP